MPRLTYRKVIVTPELLEQVNSENKKLVERFLKEKSTRSSAATVTSYRSDADIFFVWNLLHNNNVHFTKIRKLEFADFFSYTTDEMKWGSSRNNRLRSFLSSLSQFIEKFYDMEYPDFRNVVLKTIQSVPKDQRREKTILTDEQVAGLLAHLSEINTQQACWLALAVYSGSRFAELLRFTTDIIDPDNTAFDGLFLETKKEIRTKGRGRNGKMLYKYILREKFLPYYDQWLKERKSIMEKSGQNHNYLFIRKDGTPAIEDTARSWVATMERYLGVPFYAHALRHFLCTELTRKKIPQAFIQFLFGWTSAEMYNIYNDMTAKEMSWSGLENLK
jgi:site-specific recombinase XerD